MSNLIVAADISGFCTEASEILQFGGYVLTFFKVAIPLIIIALGMFDFGKAVVASDDDEIKNQTKRLVYRALAGIIIFFIPTIVLFLFNAIGTYEEDAEQANFQVCQSCVLSPWGKDCKDAVIEAKNNR